ncbi:MAG: hypothetical protein IPK08_14995 [Bacteroidetes bacterium]|nr:hypothetical protein [Bacteroidota bacterium]
MRSLAQLMLLFFVFTSCSETIDNTGTCYDGVKNQGEQGIDCGGPCQAACASCADGIMNQGETAVDCGGPCDPCYPRLSAKIDGVDWSATSRNAFISAPGMIRIYGTNTQSNFTLYYSGVFESGTTTAGSTFKGEFRSLSGDLYASTSGSISFSTFDTVARTISGTYQFLATDTTSGTQLTITSGVFNSINY